MIALRLRRVLMFEIAALTAQALAVAGDAAPPRVGPAPPHQIVTMRRTA
jgi:hypothetical protein